MKSEDVQRSSKRPRREARDERDKALKAAASGDKTQRLGEWEEDAALEAAGFKREGAVLWVKGGVCYGREAALQNARRV